MLACIAIVQKSNRFTYKNYTDVARVVYNSDSYLKVTRLKRLMTSDIVKEKVNDRIQELMIKNDLGENKYFELLKKAEKAAEKKDNSRDLLEIAREIKEMNSLAPVKTTRIVKESYNYKAELARIDNDTTNSGNEIAPNYQTIESDKGVINGKNEP